MVLIAAPPGFGKSTLVGEWAAARDETLGWVSLDTGDNDPIRFWRYVISACQTVDAALGKSTLAALRSAQQPSFESILTPFMNELTQFSSRLVLVLDDYHVITSSEIHQALTFLLDHLPSALHILFITRSEPPLPLARFRARNDLLDLAVADLRFSRDEVQTLFEQVLKLPISAESLARLEERTEGWAAGLRLLGLALEHNPAQSENLLATFAGRAPAKHILDYLVGEVFANQSESIQTFLLQTSFLNRLSGALCDAITNRNDSAQLLEQLTRANLFLIPLDAQWYRYHVLFAEAMQHLARQRLGDSELQLLFERAALWFESNGFLDQAIESLILAREFEHAAILIERLIEQRGRAEIYTLRRWIEQLPKDVLEHHPDLCFSLAMALFFTADRFLTTTVPRVEIPLQMAERFWRNEKNDAKLGEVQSLRSIMVLWQGESQRAFAYARESLELLSDDDVNWRGSSLICVGLEELFAGSIDSAQNHFIEARALCGAAQNIHGVLAALALSAEAHVWQGEFDQAAVLYEQVFADAVGGEAMLDDQSSAHLGVANVAYEQNDLEKAEQHATRALELSQPRSNEKIQVESSIILARIQHARGNSVQAQELLRALVGRIRLPLLLRQVQMWQARFAFYADDLDAVHRWYAALTQNDDVPRVQQEQEALLAARMHFAEGKPDAAIELIEPWRVDAQEHGRTRSEIETLCIKALAQSAQSKKGQAIKTLTRALTIAQPKNYRRSFIDEGKELQLLITDFRLQIEKPRALSNYVAELFAAFDKPSPPITAKSKIQNQKSEILVEPLSPQELRVLRLLASGLSNPEIARELVVSTNTIKTQLQSIYRKLNVAKREQAAELARQLKLI